MKIVQNNGREYRLPSQQNPFQQELYIHLINWKWVHITAEPGIERGRPYDAILPDRYADQFPMLYPAIVPMLREHLQRFPFRIHTYFNHMASSQAANLNLFLPILAHPKASAVFSKLKPDFARLAVDQLDHGFRIEFWDEPFGNLNDKSATVTHTPSRTPTFTPTMTALPPAVSLTEHWWIWESGVLHITPKTYPIASVKLTISDPQDRWPAVTLEIDPHKESEVVIWDRRFADGALAPSGEYPVQVRVCDDHNLCANATGRITIRDGIWPTMTPTFTLTTTSTMLPSATTTKTQLPASLTPVLIVLSPTPTMPTPQPTQWPLWQILGLAGLMTVIASASVVDPRPMALRRLGEVLEQISNRTKLDSSQGEN